MLYCYRVWAQMLLLYVIPFYTSLSPHHTSFYLHTPWLPLPYFVSPRLILTSYLSLSYPTWHKLMISQLRMYFAASLLCYGYWSNYLAVVEWFWRLSHPVPGPLFALPPRGAFSIRLVFSFGVVQQFGCLFEHRVAVSVARPSVGFAGKFSIRWFVVYYRWEFIAEE